MHIAEKLFEPDGDRHLMQRVAVDQLGKACRHRPHRFAGKGVEQLFGDEQAEDAIAEKLQPLVAETALAVRSPTGVGQRLLQQGRMAEMVAEYGFKGGHLLWCQIELRHQPTLNQLP